MEDNGVSDSWLVVISLVIVLIYLNVSTKCDHDDCVIIRARTAYNYGDRASISGDIIFHGNVV